MSYKNVPTATALGLLLLSHGAYAQQPASASALDAPPMERVQITGSRISLKHDQLAGVGPVTVIDAETIQRSGAVSIETLLQRLPASLILVSSVHNMGGLRLHFPLHLLNDGLEHSDWSSSTC